MREVSIPIGEGYTITEDGRVFSYKQGKKKERSQHIRGHGYKCVSLTVEPYKVRNFNVHSLMMLSFVGEKDGMDVRHIDGNRLNNHLSNLVYGTRSENQMDRVEHGTSNRGESHGMRKLSEEDVILIRQKYKPNEYGYIRLSRDFNTSVANIQSIVNRKSWKHI